MFRNFLMVCNGKQGKKIVITYWNLGKKTSLLLENDILETPTLLHSNISAKCNCMPVK